VKGAVFFILIFLFRAVLFAQTGGDDLITQAEEAFREGHYGESANLYQEAAVRGSVNGSLYYNQGNSWFMAGEPLLAHLSYLKASALNPGDGDIRRNLSYLRALAGEEERAGAGELLRVLFFWHYDLSLRLRGMIFLGLNALFWLLALLTIVLKRRGRAVHLWPALLALVFAAGLGTSLLVSRYQWLHYPGGLVMEETTPRKGDSDSFDSAFNRPLPGGTEFQLREIRSGWYKIRLKDGSEGWIRRESAELVTFP